MMENGKRLTRLLSGRPGALRLRARTVKAWRAVQGQMIVPVAKRLIIWLAFYYRAVLRNVIFIGVTGSCGKTTAKDLIAAVLSSKFSGRRTRGSCNNTFDISKIIFRVRPWDHFCVLETAAAIVEGEKILGPSVRLVKPHIGVVTNIGTDHISSFHSVEGIAAEKAKLIAALPRNGTAILNADDPNVLNMQSNCAGGVITYGLAPDAMVRAENVRCSWPEPLSFTVVYRGESHHVQTQLWGAHWVHSVLAALSVGIVMGVPLATAAEAIQKVAPRERRMQPVIRPDGVTVINDDMKAPFWSFPATLQFLKDAEARRKIIVIGNISDYKSKSERAYVSVARQALGVADHVVFIGPRSSKCLKAKRHPQDQSLLSFYSVEAAREHLRSLLQPGDLVLLKGSKHDRLQELFSEQSVLPHRLAAPRDRQESPEKQSTGDSVLLDSQDAHVSINVQRSADASTAEFERSCQAVVGLGNPGDQYQNTPHNAGQRTVDLLARSLGAEWTLEYQAMVARSELQGQTVYLIKPLTYINATGPMLLQLGQRFGFGPAECVLIQDDIDMQLGAVRVRARGSDGGHRGVRSVLHAFRTDAVRRVKIGVGRPKSNGESAQHVLRNFSATDSAVVESACAQAAERALQMVHGLANENRITFRVKTDAASKSGSKASPSEYCQ